jgi:hypothetical protein
MFQHLTYPATRNAPNVLAVPNLVTDISIDQSANPSQIQGAPLTLEFDQVFSRQPNPPNEIDITLTAQDLDSWAIGIW